MEVVRCTSQILDLHDILFTAASYFSTLIVYVNETAAEAENVGSWKLRLRTGNMYRSDLTVTVCAILTERILNAISVVSGGSMGLMLSFWYLSETGMGWDGEFGRVWRELALWLDGASMNGIEAWSKTVPNSRVSCDQALVTEKMKTWSTPPWRLFFAISIGALLASNS